jgi:hypothetical protein
MHFRAVAALAETMQRFIPENYPVLPRLFRDIIGNPFRSVDFDPRWRTADVMGLTTGIYEERAFDRMPLLADVPAAPSKSVTRASVAGPGVRRLSRR